MLLWVRQAENIILFHNNRTSLKGGLEMMEGGVQLHSYFLFPSNNANKYPSSQTMVFPVVVYGYESWTIKKAEH